MIINLMINLVVLFIGAVFSLFPAVEVLPTILGVDIDSLLLTWVGQMNVFMATFWPLAILMQGFLVIMGYHGIKLGLKFLIGHRTPTH